MSKNSDNPFAQLDKSLFPSSRNDAGKSRRPHGAARCHAPAEAEPADEDSALFMQALGGHVQVLGEHGRRPQGEGPRHDEEGAQLKEQFNIAMARKAEAQRHPSSAGSHDPASPRMAEDRRPVPGTDRRSRTADAAPGRKGGAPESPGQEAEQGGDDLFEFMEAVQGATPLHSRGRDVAVDSRNGGAVAGGPALAMQDAMEGPLEFAVCNRDEYAEGHVVGLDLMLLEQLKARQFSPEAHIDLHGLNSEQAYWNLLGFFRGVYFKGLRVAIVVTGRGLNSPSGIPVLKMQVQRWLAQEPLKRVVLAFCSARQEDGGTGAFYVLLRKRKKSAGKICWDIAPPGADFS